MADSIGDTRIEPKSFSLLCLEYSIPWDSQSKILGMFEEFSKNNYSEISGKEILSVLRDRMTEIVLHAQEFSDLTVYSLLRAASKYYVEDLYPLSCLLKEEFLPVADL